MASNPFMRNGTVPSRPTTSVSKDPHPATSGAQLSPTQPVNQRPRRLVLPTRYTTLEPPQPLSAFIDDPNFDTRAAALILGLSYEQLKKWRQRDEGPDYYQYGDGGPVRYALSALNAFRLAHLVVTKKKGRR